MNQATEIVRMPEFIIGIDPGNVQSASVNYDPESKQIFSAKILPNEDLLWAYRSSGGEKCVVAIEMIESFGMPVGKTVFDTCVWIGRFMEAFVSNGVEVFLVPRGKIKMYLCQSRRAKDGNIRQALLDRFPATGGGKTPQVGTKGKRGPLFGVKKDLWQALAVAIVWSETLSIRSSDHGTAQEMHKL